MFGLSWVQNNNQRLYEDMILIDDEWYLQRIRRIISATIPLLGEFKLIQILRQNKAISLRQLASFVHPGKLLDFLTVSGITSEAVIAANTISSY